MGSTTPNILTHKPIFGLDVGHGSLKVMQVDHVPAVGQEHGTPQITGYGFTTFDAAALDNGVFLEINAQPDRLDLNDFHTRLAKEAGVKFMINTDAHRVQELDCMRFGVDQARRGWCEAGDIVNTRHLAALRKLLKK